VLLESKLTLKPYNNSMRLTIQTMSDIEKAMASLERD